MLGSFSPVFVTGRHVEGQHMAIKGAQLDVASPAQHHVRVADSLPPPPPGARAPAWAACHIPTLHSEHVRRFASLTIHGFLCR